MLRTRVKICGITRIEDARSAVRCGADAIGLVFYGSSPRSVPVEVARVICGDTAPFVTRVGLFVDAAAEEVRATCARVALDLLQFHGEEPPEFCAAFGRPYLKAVRMAPGIDLWEWARRYEGAVGLLLDTFRPGLPGGTGQVFDWSLIPRDLSTPLVLAGGLNPDNVTEAIRRVRPYAVDVSGGVERTKGIKDPARIEAFLCAVAKADRSARQA